MFNAKNKTKPGKTAKTYDLKKLRHLLKMSQNDAAYSIGVSLRTWQRMESNADLVRVVQFIEANNGKFLVPESPFEIFQIGQNTFSLTEIKIFQK